MSQNNASTPSSDKTLADIVHTRSSLPRRSFMASAGLMGLGLMTTLMGTEALAGTGEPDAGLTRRASRARDIDILNFALNLEYLEAEFYQRAIGNNNALEGQISGNGTLGNVTGGAAVPFTSPDIAAYAAEIAADELAHVIFLRSALGNARVARPAIDFQASFTAAALAAGIITQGQTFDPFASETAFLLGAFIFEDVGVTAYKGGAPLILDPNILEAAAGLLAVEAYHAGEIRTLLYARRNAVVVGNQTVAQVVQKISDLRDAADGAGDLDQGITNGKAANIVPTDGNGLAFSRTPRQVLNIAYLAPGSPPSGGFFPNGANGRIS